MDTTKSSGNPVPDGIYFVSAAGCGWVAVEYHGGREVGRCEESNADTHRAAGDRWAGVVPSETDELLGTEDEQFSIDVALACGYDDAELVSVARRADA